MEAAPQFKTGQSVRVNGGKYDGRVGTVRQRIDSEVGVVDGPDAQGRYDVKLLGELFMGHETSQPNGRGGYYHREKPLAGYWSTKDLEVTIAGNKLVAR